VTRTAQASWQGTVPEGGGRIGVGSGDLLSSEGHPPTDLQTKARIRLEQTDEGFRITKIELRTTGEVPDVDQEQFAALAERAKATCPVSLALAGTEITVDAVKSS
jgi:osmotically inducible protein OsmC